MKAKQRSYFFSSTLSIGSLVISALSKCALPESSRWLVIFSNLPRKRMPNVGVNWCEVSSAGCARGRRRRVTEWADALTHPRAPQCLGAERRSHAHAKLRNSSEEVTTLQTYVLADGRDRILLERSGTVRVYARVGYGMQAGHSRSVSAVFRRGGEQRG